MSRKAGKKNTELVYSLGPTQSYAWKSTKKHLQGIEKSGKKNK